MRWRRAAQLSPLALVWLLWLSGDARALEPAEGTVVIAHRGASGYLPEHSLPAYALAYGIGAHYIEPDLVMTRDGVLITRHDLFLEATTDVAVQFPGRARGDGHWYAADFDLREIKQLRAFSPVATRYPQDAPGFSVATFAEVLQMLGELNRATGCRVGVYPETKHPDFHEREGLALEPALARELAPWVEAGLPIYVQSFAPASLRKLRKLLGPEVSLVQLVGGDREEQPALGAEELDAIGGYANGIGVHKGRVRQELVDLAHARGLVVHAYTFRADQVPENFSSFAEEVREQVRERRLDGLFTDHPGAALAALALGAGARAPARCKRPVPEPR